MLIQYVSDIHLEMGYRTVPRVANARVLVIAGDLGKPFDPSYEKFLRSLHEYERVILVAGNHEFYSSNKTVEQIEAKLERLQSISNVFVLSHRNPVTTFEDVTFVGATLWSDVSINTFLIRQCIADYSNIKVKSASTNRKIRITPETVLEWHRRDVQYLREKFHKLGGKIVVVTHHAPSFRSIVQADGLESAYASNLDDLVATSNARYWVHGHTHHLVNYRIGVTNVVCSPVGYPEEHAHYVPTAFEL